MNKEKYLNELEQLLTKNKVNNLYGIIREYSNKIDFMSDNGYTIEEIIDDLGTPEEIVSNYIEDNSDILGDIEEELEDLEKEFDNNPDEIFEKGEMYDNDRFKKPRFEKTDREKNEEMYDDQFEYNNRFQRKDFNGKQYDNRFKESGFNNPDLVRNILYIIIGLMVVSLIIRSLKYFVFGGMMGYGYTHSLFGSGIFSFISIIPTLIIIIVVVYILRKNNRK